MIEWTSSGLAFNITNMEEFCGGVLMNYFRHDKYSSFQRQLNLYGFRKVVKGPDVGAYAHPRFLRGRLDLLPEVRRLPQGHAHTALPTSSGRHTLVLPSGSASAAEQAKCPSIRPAEVSDSDGGGSDNEHQAGEPSAAPSLVASASSVREPVLAIPMWRPQIGSEASGESTRSARGVSELYPEETDSGEFAFNQLESDPAAMVIGYSGDGVVRTQPLPGATPLTLRRTPSSASPTNALLAQKSTPQDLSSLSAQLNKVALLASSGLNVNTDYTKDSSQPTKPLPLALSNDEPVSAGWRLPSQPQLSDKPQIFGHSISIPALAESAHAQAKVQSIPSPRSASAPSILLPMPSSYGRITSEQWDVKALGSDADLSLLTNEALDSIFARQASAASAVAEPPAVVEMER